MKRWPRCCALVEQDYISGKNSLPGNEQSRRRQASIDLKTPLDKKSAELYRPRETKGKVKNMATGPNCRCASHSRLLDSGQRLQAGPEPKLTKISQNPFPRMKKVYTLSGGTNLIGENMDKFHYG